MIGVGSEEMAEVRIEDLVELVVEILDARAVGTVEDSVERL